MTTLTERLAYEMNLKVENKDAGYKYQKDFKSVLKYNEYLKSLPAKARKMVKARDQKDMDRGTGQ